MKCIKRSNIVHGNIVLRVSDDEAATLVGSGGWVYCPKSEWKKQIRKESNNAK